MAHDDIFRHHLVKYLPYGYALWEPSSASGYSLPMPSHGNYGVLEYHKKNTLCLARLVPKTCVRLCACTEELTTG